MNIPENLPIDEILTRLNMLKDGGLTNASVLLFSKEPKFIQSEVKCIVLPTTEFVKPYVSYHSYEGNLFDLVDKPLAFVLENIHRPLWLEYGKAAAINPYEIPEDAVRECIVNAVVHRDYESPSKVQIRIFPDRVEIWNPGNLPCQLKIDDLKKPHPSLPKNSLIFRQFYRAGYVEDVGGGTTDIIQLCKDSELAEPKFEEKMGYLIVTIYRSVLTEKHLDDMNISERQKKAINYMKTHGKIKRTECEKLHGLSERSANRELKEMVMKKIVKKTGRGPTTFYVMTGYGEIWRDIDLIKKRKGSR
ncbi:MAG: hypothetical protein CVT89_08145 [Candidatus Altiarchaeales archaeon HGW-Altiarchaeales-2]|nr:MAG: hypothetical protein CVT89_08145 [Candidatus Altiarchaeales archaeon HGW-Altiarchaeales-2]